MPENWSSNCISCGAFYYKGHFHGSSMAIKGRVHVKHQVQLCYKEISKQPFRSLSDPVNWLNIWASHKTWKTDNPVGFQPVAIHFLPIRCYLAARTRKRKLTFTRSLLKTPVTAFTKMKAGLCIIQFKVSLSWSLYHSI